MFLRSASPAAQCEHGSSIRDLVAEFPEAEKEPYGLAHILLLNHIMKYVAEKILGDPRWPTDRLALVHDRGAFDAVLADAFGHMKNDETLLHHERFTTMTAMGWEECIPLQAADQLAHENFRCVERETAGHKRRKALELILAIIGMCTTSFSLWVMGLMHILLENKILLYASNNA